MTVYVSDKLSADEYHADDAYGTEPSISSGLVKILTTQSPLHAFMAHPRLNPFYEREESEDFDLGTAAHALLLEGDDLMVEVDADSWRTKAAKEQRAAIRLERKLPVLTKYAERVRAMVEIARQFYPLVGGVAERSITWSERVDGGHIFCRARPDWLSLVSPLILDYKTVESADPRIFARQMIAMGYDIQAAHYTRAWRAMNENAVEDPQFVFLLQERTAPHCCSLVGVDPTMLELGMSKVRTAYELWAECLRSGKWPAYPTAIFWTEAPAWALQQWDDRRGAA